MKNISTGLKHLPRFICSSIGSQNCQYPKYTIRLQKKRQLCSKNEQKTTKFCEKTASKPLKTESILLERKLYSTAPSLRAVAELCVQT